MGIRELKKLQDDALEAYHAEHSRLESEIEAIRAKRKPRTGGQDMPGGKNRAEQDAYLMNLADGRSIPRNNGNW